MAFKNLTLAFSEGYEVYALLRLCTLVLYTLCRVLQDPKIHVCTRGLIFYFVILIIDNRKKNKPAGVLPLDTENDQLDTKNMTII